MKRLLIVDDNDKYAALIDEYFAARGYTSERVYSAQEGIDKIKSVGPEYYSLVVTDITMESQLAGLKLTSYLHKTSFPGTVIVASTGFDIPPGMLISKFYFGAQNVRYLIPKTTVLKKDFVFYEPKLFTKPTKEFKVS